MLPREPKAGRTTMPLDTALVDSSGASGRCSQTKSNLTSNKRSVYQ